MEKVNICIIKLGALGDVVRTTPILSAIKEKYPESNVIWITKKDSKDFLEGITEINDILTIPLNELDLGDLDILYNFDIDEAAMDLASKINAKEKLGFYGIDGFPVAFNSGAEYYLETIFNDDLKKSNKKTYQEMIFEVANLHYKHQNCLIKLNDHDKRYSEEYIRKIGLVKGHKKLIGIHMGASPRWPSKTWHLENLKDFIKKIKNFNYEIILFGGPNEKESHPKFIKELESEGITVYRNDPNNTIKEFSSMLNLCDVIICGDTLALHIAMALNKHTIGLFFCTSANEIEGYGRLTKLVSPQLYDFFPERMNEYNEELTKSISSDEVIKALNNFNK